MSRPVLKVVAPTPDGGTSVSVIGLVMRQNYGVKGRGASLGMMLVLSIKQDKIRPFLVSWIYCRILDNIATASLVWRVITSRT
jgi:hypothetical protein